MSGAWPASIAHKEKPRRHRASATIAEKKEEPRRSGFPSAVLDTEGETGMDTEDCRAKARELRQKARTANDSTNRAHLLVMAEQYYWFAGWIEDQAQQRTPEQP
jgi:hypothetical protein